jgi:hypothetical protein
MSLKYKSILFLLILFGFMACSPSPEVQLVKLIEDRYANLYVNNEKQKREALEGVRNYLQGHELNDSNLDEFRSKLNQINDGHMVLFDNRNGKNIRFVSGVVFVPGTNYIEKCDNCLPVLPKDKYQIIEVNKSPLNDYLEKEKYTVAASTPWGREFRLIRLFKEKSNKDNTILKLKSSSGIVITSKLDWRISFDKAPLCVSSKRLKNDLIKLNIYNLWCDDKTVGTSTREQIFENFKIQFDKAMSSARENDKIVIDLRENGGGGDFEVEYILNSFLKKSVILYHYKYLRKNTPGIRKWLEIFWPLKLSLWAPDEYEYTNLSRRPKKTFFNNNVITLVSAGCFSSCETIASILKLEKHSVLLGSRTHGGSGDPVIYPIKGTPFSLNIPSCLNWQSDGKFYEGVGVLPDREVLQSDMIKSDNVLTTAIDLVQ